MKFPEWTGQIYVVLTLLPTFAIVTRRMHDVNKSGWYGLIPIYSIVLLFTEGTKGKNDYGDSPLVEETVLDEDDDL